MATIAERGARDEDDVLRQRHDVARRSHPRRGEPRWRPHAELTRDADVAEDAQRAIRLIRHRQAEFGIDPARIAAMGFSAGGHLAGFTAYQPARALYAGADRFEAASARPDFAVLLFPVVTLRKPYDTTRTRREIVGEKATAEVEAAWSLDTYASRDAPPTIIFAAADDATTPPGHGILLFQTLVAAGASAELHLFRDGGHGWGLGKPGQVISQWPALFETWARSLQIIEKQGE
jgi:acetyl esterase/lipase